MHRHQWRTDELGRGCCVLQAGEPSNHLKGDETAVMGGFDVTKRHSI